MATTSLFKILQQITRFTQNNLARFTQLLSKTNRNITIAILVVVAILTGNSVSAQLTTPAPALLALGPLSSATIPEPANLNEFLVTDKKTGVVDKAPAIALGKALFWDMQIGSDGIQSCASCHFHAGADPRSKNQLAPALLRVNADGTANPDQKIELGGLDYTLKPGDYPFHKLADPSDRNSSVLSDINDITSSQGVTSAKFVDVVPGKAEDSVTYQSTLR